MMRHDPSRHSRRNRPGKILVLFALLLPLLFGMVGLAIDGGLLLSTYRQTQNAADTAALSAAYDLLNNLSAASATTTGTTYVQTNNNMANATVTINIPPSSGPHAGSASFAEALISYPYQTSFIQLLGVNTNQTVGARAVAGFEGSTTGAGITTLQQSTTSGGGTAGITVSGGATLTINGPIVDNATTSSAFSTSGGTVSATSTSVAATTGVNYFDPLANLPVPSTATGVVNTAYGAFTASGPGTQTLSPGIYTSINISNGATVIFSPGTYVITGGGLNIDNTSTVSGNGVLFYNTGKSYSAVPSETNPIPIVGLDSTTSGGGLRALPNDRGTTNQYGSITLNGNPTWNLTPISDTHHPHHGILIFHDRKNTKTVTVSGGTPTNPIGTIYASNTLVNVSGGSFTQLIVGSLSATSGSTTVSPQSQSPPAQANLVYLVE